MVDREHDNHEITRAPTRADLIRLAKSLNDASACYIIIGGMAIIEHGLRRTTMDIDLLIDDSPENVRKTCLALSVLEDGAAREVNPMDVQDYVVVRINDEITIDLMGSACGIDYNSAKPMIEWHELDGIKIPFASLELIWKTKQTLREKDSLDRAFLRKLIESENLTKDI